MIRNENGLEYLCYGKEERLDLIQTLTECNGYKASLEKCAAKPAKTFNWTMFVVGAAVGAVGASLLLK